MARRRATPANRGSATLRHADRQVLSAWGAANMIYALAIMLPSVALWIDGQRISAFLNLVVCGVSAYYAFTLTMFAPLLAGPIHALILIYLTSATRVGRRRASTPAGMPRGHRRPRDSAG